MRKNINKKKAEPKFRFLFLFYSYFYSCINSTMSSYINITASGSFCFDHVTVATFLSDVV